MAGNDKTQGGKSRRGMSGPEFQRGEKILGNVYKFSLCENHPT